MAGDPVASPREVHEFQYRVQDIIVMYLYTIPRTPFFLSFLALIYVMFLLFLARQESEIPFFVSAILPTLGCALIGIVIPTVTALFSETVKSRRVVEVNEGGLNVTVADQLTPVPWDQVKSVRKVVGRTFLKLKNGSYLMLPQGVEIKKPA
ncbi:MAG: hypothetical protein ISP91_16610 [Pseudomonadales bacterium]|nr:hypothetical protein [Pseudomonadales bacterium]